MFITHFPTTTHVHSRTGRPIPRYDIALLQKGLELSRKEVMQLCQRYFHLVKVIWRLWRSDMFSLIHNLRTHTCRFPDFQFGVNF